MKYELDPDETTSMAVVQAVSAAENCSARSLPPLYNAVNPDALDDLFASPNGDTTDRWGSVSFTFSKSLVTVTHSEYIEVAPLVEFETSAEQREHS